jgi:uncharacterized protein (DUF433 family)
MGQASNGSLDRFVESTPGVRGEKPRISGTRITVADIATMHLKLDEALETIAADYQLPLAAVYAAMAYYYDHRPEIDRSIAEDEAFAEAFARKNVSPLREKLRALKGV